MRTITIQVGNTDNKLSQARWAEFVNNADMYIAAYETERHFFGAALPFTPWQNAAWVIAIDDKTDDYKRLKHLMGLLCREYHQDSIAWIEGEIEFISKDNYK